MQNEDSPPNSDHNEIVPQFEHNPNKITTRVLVLSVGLLGICLLFAIGGYLIGSKESTTQQTQVQPNQELAPIETALDGIAKEQPVAKDSISTSVPSTWTYKSNGECNVSFPIPPKSEPYYFPPNPNIERSVTKDLGSGRFWDFPRGGVYPDMLSLLAGDNQTSMQANAMFASDDEASGYVSAVISVSCSNNTLKLDNQMLVNKLKDGMQRYNQDPSDKGMGPNTYTIVTTSNTDKWDRPVIELTVNKYYLNLGGEPVNQEKKYTIFADAEYIYEASIIGESAELSVLETAEMIFSNLIFE